MNEWFRSWHGAPTDPKWRTIAKRAGVPPERVIAFAWAMLDRASQADHRGSIDGVDLETIADFMGCEVEDLERIVAAMHDKAVLVNDKFVAWEKRQPKRERDDDTAAERKRAQRERDSANMASDDGGTPDVTPSHAASHQVTPREEKRREDKKEPRVPRDFDRFWEAWPNKVGKLAAERAFKRRSSEAEAIIAGIAPYARSKPPDRPWLNPATFINDERWRDKPASINGTPQLRLSNPDDPIVDLGGGVRWPESRLRQAVAEFRANPRGWVPILGPPPDDPSCRVPRHLLNCAA